MLIHAEQLLQYQRCQRRPYLDIYGDKSLRDAANDLLLKLQQDRADHQASIVSQFNYHRPEFPQGNWSDGSAATLELMRQGVECIYQGVLLGTSPEGYTLLSRPDLLVKRPGKSCLGDWLYLPTNIELGKRPKQEYQVVIAFHAYVLEQVQQVELSIGWLILRGKDAIFPVDLRKWSPQMQQVVQDYTGKINSEDAPEVFISRQKCSLCHWYSSCYAIAKSEKHLSLLPGVTPVRYTQLKSIGINTLESLANTSALDLENLPGFDSEVADKMVLQAQAVLENRPLVLPEHLPELYITYTAPVEIYFDIEAQPDLHLNYLLGVLVVDREADTEKFYSFLAEKPEDEKIIWQQFLDLVWEYSDAPIYHFCAYEYDTVKRLAKYYRTPSSLVNPVLDRFVDVYDQLTQSVALPLDSYALKAIAKWLGFEWRDPEASGAKCIYWYDQWLETGDRALLDVIQRYNEDDCRATRNVKDWLVNFFEEYQS